MAKQTLDAEMKSNPWFYLLLNSLFNWRVQLLSHLMLFALWGGLVCFYPRGALAGQGYACIYLMMFAPVTVPMLADTVRIFFPRRAPSAMVALPWLLFVSIPFGLLLMLSWTVYLLIK